MNIYIKRRFLWAFLLLITILLPIRISFAQTYSTQYLVTKSYSDWSKDDVVIYLIDKATEYGLDPYLVYKIVNAESGFKYLAHNKIGTASGLFQFLDSTFVKLCIKRYGYADSMDQKNDIMIQTDCALSTISDGGLGNWDESKHLWSK